MSLLDRWRKAASRLFRLRADAREAADVAEPEWIAVAAVCGQRVVFTDWVGVWTIGEDGTPFFATRVDLADQFEITDARDRNVLWFRAAERYPDLAQLRPIRRRGDYDCPSCGGTGELRLPPGTTGTVWCSCGGVGWLPNGYVDPHRDPAV